MDLFLPRQEIRRQALAMAGYTTDALLSVQDRERINALIDNASMMVSAMSRWISLVRRVSLPIDAGQQIIAYRQLEQAYWMQATYPAQYNPGTYGTAADTWVASDLASAPINNVGPSGLIEVSAWEETSRQFVPLLKGVEGSRYSQERFTKMATEVNLTSTYAGDTVDETIAKVASATSIAEMQRSQPYSFEPQNTGFQVWPIVDKRYVLRVHYSVTPTWDNSGTGLSALLLDQQSSLVDAQAIILHVVSDLYAQQGDDFNTKRYEGRFAQRIANLRSWQSTGESISPDREAAFDKDYESDRRVPQWDIGPKIRA